MTITVTMLSNVTAWSCHSNPNPISKNRKMKINRVYCFYLWYLGLFAQSSSLVNFAANCGPLSDTMLSGNPYNFHILSLNNLTNSSADVPFVVATKYIILDNLLQTTRMVFFLATNGNFIIKSTIRCVHGFSGTSLNFNFPATSSVLFFIL